ncbi:MAG: protease modulator HflK, partial [Burkholderiaceae bacterium]|nr:protease modulator HflK [Burkholderiaceae bacterium]
GDASRFRQVLTEYQKAPLVTRDRMYIDTMQQVFSNTTKVLVDSRQSNQLLYLPFDKLMQQALQDSAAPRPAPAAGAESTAPVETRSRDTSLRSRDREAR